jgi:hypothetical protein
MWQGIIKNGEKKLKKIKIFPRVLPRDTRRRDPSPSAYSWHSGKRLLPRVLAHGTRGRGHLPRVLEHGTWEDIFHFFGKRFRPKAPSNAKFLLWLSLVPECCTRGRRLSPSVTLPRVPWVLRHSGKPLFPECNTRGRLASLSARFLALGEEFGTQGISVLP